MRISDWSSDVCSSDLAVDVQSRGRAHAGAVQHRRPEQAVEVDDVLADEVVQLGLAAGRKVLEEVRAVAFAQRLEAAQVADRRVQPDVQELARVARDLEAEEIGRASWRERVCQYVLI